MISKEVLAKVNKIIAVAVTKHRIKVVLHNFTNMGNTLQVTLVQDDYTSVYRDGSGSAVNWIHLDRKNCFAQLNDTLRWLHTLENRHELRNM